MSRPSDAPRLRARASLLSGALLLGGTACRQEPPSPFPHVLLVTLDTVRADHLGSYGYFRETTPQLDELAEEALLFERCWAPMGQTLPSHTSLFTGLQPYEHGILANMEERKVYAPAPGVSTFAQAARAVGYTTAAFVAAEPVKRGTGLELGFEHWWEPEERKADAEQVVDRALEWLGDGPPAPSFVWLHLFDAHAPYAPPPPHDTRFEADAELEAFLDERAILRELPSRLAAFSGDASTEHDLYDGELSYADEQLGRVFRRLRSLGLWSEMVVVVTGDHGECLKQHGRNGHGHLWLENLHVPFLLKAPGLPPGRRGDPAASVDVLPAMLAAVPSLGAALSEWSEQPTGRNLLAGTVPAPPILAQLPGRRAGESWAIVQDGWRLVQERDAPRLFRLDDDPHELVDRAASEPERVAALSALAEELMAAQRALGASLGAGGVVRADESRVQGLEELGYGGAEEEE